MASVFPADAGRKKEAEASPYSGLGPRRQGLNEWAGGRFGILIARQADLALWLA